MRRKFMLLNNISILCFFFSSASLLGVPFLNLDEEFPTTAYILAGLFWSGLILGIILQIIVGFGAKKIQSERKKMHKERPFIIFFVVFLLLFLLILLFCRESIMLMSIDLAFMLFSIEMFFYVKRRYNI